MILSFIRLEKLIRQMVLKIIVLFQLSGWKKLQTKNPEVIIEIISLVHFRVT